MRPEFCQCGWCPACKDQARRANRRQGFLGKRDITRSNKGGWGSIESAERWKAFTERSNANFRQRVDTILGRV